MPFPPKIVARVLQRCNIHSQHPRRHQSQCYSIEMHPSDERRVYRTLQEGRGTSECPQHDCVVTRQGLSTPVLQYSSTVLTRTPWPVSNHTSIPGSWFLNSDKVVLWQRFLGLVVLNKYSINQSINQSIINGRWTD